MVDRTRRTRSSGRSVRAGDPSAEGQAQRMALRAHGIGVTRQRVAVLSYLMDNPGHPDAEQVFRAMRARSVPISLASVYNTLHLFSDKGLLIPLDMEEGRVRFDTRLLPHAHFRCSVCGGIRDLPLDVSALPAPGAEGCRIDRRDVSFYGVCDRCLHQQAAKE